MGLSRNEIFLFALWMWHLLNLTLFCQVPHIHMVKDKPLSYDAPVQNSYAAEHYREKGAIFMYGELWRKLV